MLLRRSFLAALPCVAVSLTARAQGEIPAVRLDIFKKRLTTHTLDVIDLKLSNGRAFRIFRAVPKGDAPTGGFPALYMLDGNAAFDALTEELLAQVPSIAIFAVGYPTRLRFDVNHRSLDYTPSPDGKGPTQDPQRPGRQIGGAETFLALLEGEIRRVAETDLHIDERRRFLWGHSYGGLFALYTLLHRPSVFAGYAAISPSVWRARSYLELMEERAHFAGPRLVRLLVALGDHEQRSNETRPLVIEPAPATMGLIERLRRHDHLLVTSEVLEGHRHGETLAASLPLVFEWIAKMK